jgi:glycosyltransferase involved in cell wall biosynthesis
VVTDIAAARDVTGISGGVQVVPQRSPAALAECIARVLRCPEVFRSDAIQSRQKLVEKFDWSSVAEGYELILLRVAGNVPHV